MTRSRPFPRTQNRVNATWRSGVFIHVTFLTQGRRGGVGGAYDLIAVDDGDNGGALSLGLSDELAETEEAAVGPWGSQQQFWSVLADIWRDHYTSLVRLAALFLDGGGEDAVQDAFVRVARRWDGIRDADRVLVYVRRAVVNVAISERRDRRRVEVLSLDAFNQGLLPRLVVDGKPPMMPSAMAGEEIALRRLADEGVVRCVRGLPGRQRECIGLRFCLLLSEKETAKVLGIHPGSVKRHVSRAMAKLRPVLESYR